jgi:hypothetical protein
MMSVGEDILSIGNKGWSISSGANLSSEMLSAPEQFMLPAVSHVSFYLSVFFELFKCC